MTKGVVPHLVPAVFLGNSFVAVNPFRVVLHSFSVGGAGIAQFDRGVHEANAIVSTGPVSSVSTHWRRRHKAQRL